jgi:CHAT domain-containing protein
LPFGALRLNGQYLVERWLLSTVSAASLLSVVPAATPPVLDQLYALANPTHLGWASLPGAEAEVQDIAPYFSTTQVYAGAQATRQRLVGQDLHGRVVHLAMHGQAGELSETRLVLSDGYLGVQDIWGLAL